MRIIFSRKGFDSAAGKAPSPILDGRPLSLPIPTTRRSTTTYDMLGLGDIVEHVSRGRLSRNNLCHHDPMFENGKCAFGQTGAAQSHLANNSVGVGDVFLFFGLFAHSNGQDRHHRFFGYMSVDEIVSLGSSPNAGDHPLGFSMRHPHTLGEWNSNNTLYIGPGATTDSTCDELRLSLPGGSVSRWRVPSWLREVGLTYHARTDRWEGADTLNVVARGQEFVADIGEREDAHHWCENIISTLKGHISNE